MGWIFSLSILVRMFDSLPSIPVVGIMMQVIVVTCLFMMTVQWENAWRSNTIGWSKWCLPVLTVLTHLLPFLVSLFETWWTGSHAVVVVDLGLEYYQQGLDYYVTTTAIWMTCVMHLRRSKEEGAIMQIAMFEVAETDTLRNYYTLDCLRMFEASEAGPSGLGSNIVNSWCFISGFQTQAIMAGVLVWAGFLVMLLLLSMCCMPLLRKAHMAVWVDQRSGHNEL